MIRKSIASFLITAAVAVEKNQSKEKIAKWVHDTRVKVAKAIEPNNWSVKATVKLDVKRSRQLDGWSCLGIHTSVV